MSGHSGPAIPSEENEHLMLPLLRPSVVLAGLTPAFRAFASGRGVGSRDRRGDDARQGGRAAGAATVPNVDRAWTEEQSGKDVVWQRNP
jgi:hypothetical protein